MTSLPKGRLPGVLVAVAALAFVLASCNSNVPSVLNPGGGNVPLPGPSSSSAPSSVPSSAPSSSAAPTGAPSHSPSPAPHSPSPAPSKTPAPTPTPVPTPTPTVGPLACAAPAAPIPGTYTTIIAIGNTVNSVFSPIAGSALWVRYMYTPATPAPTPSVSPTVSPTSSPTTAPTPQPVYIYLGTFKLTLSGGGAEPTGCALFVTTKDGSPLNGTNANSADNEFPNITQLVHATLVTNGLVSTMSITLTGTTGSGTFTLSDGSTGTISLTSRVGVPSLQQVQSLLHHR